MNVKAKRPIAMSFLGYILIIGGSFSIINILLSGSFTFDRDTLNILLKATAIIAGIGFLKMRKWSFYVWLFGFIMGTVLIFAFPPSVEILEYYSSINGLLALFFVPTIVTALSLVNWKKLK